MTILYTKSGNGAKSLTIKECIPVEDFLNAGEYDQNDFGLIAYDDLYDYIKKIKE